MATKGAPFFFAPFGIPFVLAGLYITVGRFFLDSYRRARTYYAVTDQRAIILSGLTNREVKRLSHQGLNDVSLNERSDGRGGITFGPANPLYSMWSGTAWPGIGKKLVPAFDLIPDVRRVYDLIRDAQRLAVSNHASQQGVAGTRRSPHVGLLGPQLEDAVAHCPTPHCWADNNSQNGLNRPGERSLWRGFADSRSRQFTAVPRPGRLL
ncbi:MAG: hypothetical protein ACLPXB_18055 [Thiobacillaceae bacterium]